MNVFHELRETRVLFHAFCYFIPLIICVLSTAHISGRAIRAQNFNYLRKISIDSWREIERPTMKYG